jgi:hypothetical protein
VPALVRSAVYICSSLPLLDISRQDCLAVSLQPHVYRRTWAILARGVGLDYGILIAVLLVCGVCLSRNMADPDLWGHVQYGRDVFRDGLPTTATYSYIARDYPWINHEIVSEAILALAADWGGPIGIMVGKTLLGMAVAGLIAWWALRRGVHVFAATLTMLLVGMTLADHWSCRPQLFSYVSTTLMFALLSWCFEGWEGPWRFFRWPQSPSADQPPIEYSSQRMRWLWLMPVLMVAWTNAHGGFLAGLCIFIAYLGLRGIELVMERGWEACGLLKRFAMMIVATTLATFLNPYGPRFHLWLFDDLKVPRPEILEWRPPDFTDPLTLPFALVVGTWLLTLFFSKKQRDFTHTVVLALLTWQSLEHGRHGAFLAIAFGFWAPPHVASLLERYGIGREETAVGSSLPLVWKRLLVGGLTVVYLLLGYYLFDRATQLTVPRDQYPVSAFEFLGKHRFHGKLMCTFNWAQYALAAFAPTPENPRGLLVHVDGRCRTSYSQEMLDAHFDFILGDVGPDIRYRDPQSGPYDPTRVLRDGNPDLVLLCRQQANSAATMETQQEHWTLLYQDAMAQVWGRKAKYDDPASADYLPPAQREITDTQQEGSVTWPGYTWHNAPPQPQP